MPPPQDPDIPFRDSIICPGEIAPAFTLPDQNREDWVLSEHLRMGDVVLCFFPFAFTQTCGSEMECLSSAFDRWDAAGATCVGISCDSHAALRAWTEIAGLRQTLLSDMHRAACRAYGLFWAELNVAMRGTVIIGKTQDPVGVVKWSQVREPGVAMDFDAVMHHLE